MRATAWLIVAVFTAAACGGDGGSESDVGTDASTSTSVTAPSSSSPPTDPTESTSTTSDAEPDLPLYEGTIPSFPLIRHEDFPETIAGAGAMIGFSESGIAAVMPSSLPESYKWSNSHTSLVGTLFEAEPHYELDLRAVPVGEEPGPKDPHVIVSVGALASSERPPTEQRLREIGYEVAADLEPITLSTGDSSLVFVADNRFGRSFVVVDGQHFVALLMDDACEDDDSLRIDGFAGCFSWSEIQEMLDSLAVVSPESLGWSL